MKVYATFLELQASTQNSTGSEFVVRDRANANYILQAIGYVALGGDATMANGRVAKLQVQNGVDVRQFGATGDGVTDDSAAFEAAAIAAVSAQYLTQGSVIRPPTSEVQIPNGVYNLTRVIASDNKYIAWYLSEGAFIPTQDLWDSYDTDYKFGLRDQEQYLFGRVIRAGRIVSSPMGTRDQGVGFAVQMSAGNPARGAEIAGFSSYASPGGNSERPAVGIYADAVASVQEQIERASGVTYTSTSASFSTPLTTSEIARLRNGMLVDTNHTGIKYTGIMTGWASNGSSITMNSWYELDNTAAGQTPPNTAGLKINPITKVWGANFNTYIPANSNAHASTGLEIGLLDWKSDSVQYLTEGRDIAVDASQHYAWGLHVTNLSSFNYKANSLIQLDGASWYAISTGNTCSNGFYYKGGGSALIAENDTLPTRGRIINDGRYFFETNTTIDTGVPNKNGSTFWDSTIKTTAVGGLELGRQFGVSAPSIDFHTSGGNIDYDARVRATNGDGATNGNGFLRLEADGAAGRVYLDANDVIVSDASRIRPADNNVTKNGDTANRWSQTYSVELRVGTVGDVVWTNGTGTPEGAVTAAIGSMFTRRDGGASTTLYVKESGAGNTGWVAK
jgi:hypothetical protein